ncbi:PREDICTED: late embryogenesis abundant protein 6-like isoform X4 [Lupinus angustifolius]|uniref:late embryogenesis abundant protein 6-like isoform X4 n=1 Tax=Lupinus angustifolius TaxID=3871 RepID=UPI00092E8E85|nr:PREDICTED: late embryogenesis abundant protein 6-like isoform X4 [Lupinus angustifolius]
MQAVKDKLQDMTALRKAKAEAKAQERAEKENAKEMMNNNPADKDIAKARMDIAHEVRRAKEAEAAMALHVAKAGERAEREIAKHSPYPDAGGMNMHGSNMHGSNMHGSNMHGTNMDGTNMHGAPHGSHTRK